MRKTVTLSVLISVILTLATAFIVARYFVYKKVQEVIVRELNALRDNGVHVRFDSIHAHWVKNYIHVEALTIQKISAEISCTNSEFMTAEHLELKGFDLIHFLLRHELSFRSVTVTRPHAFFYENSDFFKSRTDSPDRPVIVLVKFIHLSNAYLEWIDSSSCTIKTKFQSGIDLSHLKLELGRQKPLWDLSGASLHDIELELPEDLYSMHIKDIRIDNIKHEAVLDSLKIIPLMEKIEFGRKKGYEIDRIEGEVPFIRMTGFVAGILDTPKVAAHTVEIQMFLRIFRDKRLPFKDKTTKLPREYLDDLSSQLEIDTLKVIQSFISYEEFDEEADSSGRVFFDNLRATITNISNGDNANRIATLEASALFLGDGLIRINGTFPPGGKKKYFIEGNLQGLNLRRINPMLEPHCKIRIEEGTMDNLSFRFHYNNTRADGKVELNYHRLKLALLKEENGDVKEDKLRSLIVNAFVVRKNMDEKLSEEKRSGTIMFYRDNSRSIFNFWWKSLFSGIKSAYNLDKLLIKKQKRDGKKIERLVRKKTREERKKQKQLSRSVRKFKSE